MSEFHPLRELPPKPGYTDKDVMVIFGEVFSRGYVNGLIEEAEKVGMKVIYSTVGRRDENNELRPLTPEEIAEKAGPLINVPLEAGFDLEKAKNGKTPCDQLTGIKLSGWQQVQLDWQAIEESQQAGVERFRKNVGQWLDELQPLIPEGGNVIFVHTMAGGFPRAKVVMPVANRAFKGFGDRYASSEEVWKSDIGKLCEMSFNEVTGESLQHLIDLTSDLREQWKNQGRKVSYLAFGYHGTEVLVGDEYRWQSYSPYLQGWAKLRLEEVAKKAHSQGVSTCVFNAPEILTNSSSIFLGVEVSLYPLLGALLKEGGSQGKEWVERCQSLLKDEHSVSEILDYTTKYLDSDTIREWSQFEAWPQHNGPKQMEMMRTSSAELIDMHKDKKELTTSVLSEVVFRATGKCMFHEAWEPRRPVWWIGHDVVAKTTAQ